MSENQDGGQVRRPRHDGDHWGLILARKAPSWYGLSALVKVVPPSPAASTLTMLAGPGDFALRISRRELWPRTGEQPQMDDG